MRNPDVMSTPEHDQTLGEAEVTVKFYKGNMANVERLTVEQAEALRQSLTAFLDGAPEPDQGPCNAEIHSWDSQAFRPEQVDPYWIRCTLLGKHDEHEDLHTGLKWRSGLPVEGESE